MADLHETTVSISLVAENASQVRDFTRQAGESAQAGVHVIEKLDQEMVLISTLAQRSAET